MQAEMTTEEIVSTWNSMILDLRLKETSINNALILQD